MYDAFGNVSIVLNIDEKFDLPEGCKRNVMCHRNISTIY